MAAAVPEPCVIGRYYRVPCVDVPMWNGMVPVFGPLHEDREIIGFPEEHWHIDWRFVPSAFIDQRTSRGVVHGLVVSWKNARGGIVMLRRKCRREMPDFPTHPHSGREVFWLRDLEANHRGARLKCGRICPHRGLPLAGCPVKDGVVVCPGHGLAWNVDTGELVRRLDPDKPTIQQP